MKLETLLQQLRQPRACPHPREVVLVNGAVTYKLHRVLHRRAKARVWSGGEEVGDFIIDFQKNPGALCRRGDSWFLFQLSGGRVAPYPHPHVFSSGAICLGSARDPMTALMNINADSMATRMPYRRRRQ